MPLSGLGLVENLPLFHLTTALPAPNPTPFGKLTRDKPPGALRGGSKKAATHTWGGGCQGPGITLRHIPHRARDMVLLKQRFLRTR